jgi:uncharacterized phage protein (TIGR01671 family)
VREIKFRGRKTSDNEWVYGSLIIDTQQGWYHIADKETGSIWSVIPETIGQYTGLKDKNGKEIYEGDIIQYGGYYANVIWKDSGLILKWINIDYLRNDLSYWITIRESNVIGNIYENPELLNQPTTDNP